MTRVLCPAQPSKTTEPATATPIDSRWARDKPGPTTGSQNETTDRCNASAHSANAAVTQG